MPRGVPRAFRQMQLCFSPEAIFVKRPQQCLFRRGGRSRLRTFDLDDVGSVMEGRR